MTPPLIFPIYIAMTPLLLETFAPLAFLIVLGFVVGRLQRVDLKSIAVIAIYAITPIVAFGSAARLDFTFSLILLPLCTFLIAGVIGLTAFWLGRCLKNDGTRYLLPVACGSGNTGYFGLPVAMALFGADAAGLYFLANLGVVIFEMSVGYYFIARGNVAPAVALKKVAQLPVLYALTAGLVVAAMAIDFRTPPSNCGNFPKAPMSLSA
jgi:predicted permease